MAERKSEVRFPPEYNPEDENSDLSRLYNLMKKQELKEADAVVWSAGDLDDRNAKCIQLIQRNYAPNLLLSSGKDDANIGSIRAGRMKKNFLDAGIPEKRILLDDESKNTKHQAENVIKIAKDKNWQKIILVANPYHQIRFFLTCLAELKRQKLENEIEIINAPADLNWFRKTPRGREEVELLVEEEIPRLIKYAKNGDVAMPADGIEYLEHWQQQKVNKISRD